MLITVLVRRPVRGTFAGAWNIAVRTRGVFTHRTGFHEARVRKKGPGAHGTALGRTGLVRTASQLFSGELGANHTNHITSNKSHTPTTSPAPENHAPIKPAAPATPHINPQQPQHQRQKPHTNRITNARSQRRTHQRFLYCDGETPNISLKYFAKYFCVPKPTASETSTTLSPASADNSWAALLSRMVRMNTEGFIP